MSTHEHPPKRVRRSYSYEIEFAFPAWDDPGACGPASPEARSIDDLFDARQKAIRERLLDPRLQRIIAAAANGWVVERLR
jgi:hypothetical protein